MKKRATYAFQRWVCLRDCEEYQRGGMSAPCFSCGRLKKYKDLQGGHFLAGRGNAILFIEQGCNCQCRQCNSWPEKNHVPEKYLAHMLEKYGKTVVDKIYKLKGTTKEYNYEDLEEIYKKYYQKALDLGVKL